MKRVRRLTANALALLSLLVACATASLGLRDSARGETVLLKFSFDGRRQTRFLQIWSAAGGMRVMLGWQWQADPFPLQPNAPPEPWFAHGTYDPGPVAYPINRFDGEAWTWHGFEYYRRNYSIATYAETFRSVTVPTFLLSFLASLFPFVWLVRIIRSMRAAGRSKRGCCVQCGYDLRASIGRCSECGTVIPPKATAA